MTPASDDEALTEDLLLSPGHAHVDRRLLDAMVSVADGLELEPTLRRIVRASAELTGAKYAALGILNEDGMHKAFVFTGMDAAMARRLGHPPLGHGVLGHITRVGHAVRVTDLSRHPASTGFPADHPPMHTFLGVPVGIRERVVGNLYLAEKPGGFTADDEDVVVALAAAAAVAVDNASLYEDARRREQWMEAAQEITTYMLSGAGEDEALQLLVERARVVSQAAVAALVLPGLDGAWVLEIADGEGSDELIGTMMPDDGRAATVARSGTGLIEASMATEPSMKVDKLRTYGPALYAPLVAGDEHLGSLLLLRSLDDPEFTQADLTTAQTFAGQAAVAIQLADGRRRSEEAEVLEERARIARDLHDLVVQELFAMGMRLHRLSDVIDPAAKSDIVGSLESLDRVVRQIRTTIRALRDPHDGAGPVERMHREANRALATLGLRAVVEAVDAHGEPLRDEPDLPPEYVDDCVAVVREGLSNAARHGKASHATVRFSMCPTEIQVQVYDDGAGLPPKLARRSGLDNLAERARRHGGTFTAARDASGVGTRMIWSIPLTG